MYFSWERASAVGKNIAVPSCNGYLHALKIKSRDDCRRSQWRGAI